MLQHTCTVRAMIRLIKWQTYSMRQPHDCFPDWLQHEVSEAHNRGKNAPPIGLQYKVSEAQDRGKNAPPNGLQYEVSEAKDRGTNAPPNGLQHGCPQEGAGGGDTSERESTNTVVTNTVIQNIDA